MRAITSKLRQVDDLLALEGPKIAARWEGLADDIRYGVLSRILDGGVDDPGPLLREMSDMAGAMWSADIEWRMRFALKIQRDDGTLVPLVPNEIQGRMLDEWRRCKRDRIPVRWAVPKARKMGVSTFTGGLFYDDIRGRSGRNATVVGYDWENTDILRQIYDVMIENDGPGLQPVVMEDNRTRVRFSSPMRSMIRTWSAENIKAGRGDTIHNLHASEAAWWGEMGDKTLASLLNAVPSTTWDTAVVLESTGNGDSGIFYQVCSLAEAGENDYTLFFFPWNDFSQYSLPFRDRAEMGEFVKTLDKEERRIRKAYSLSLEQLKWRRWKIRNDAPGDSEAEKLRWFRQEFPLSMEEAFQATGGGDVFDPDLCAELSRSAPRKPIFRGDIHPKKGEQVDSWRTPTPVLFSNPRGPLRLFNLFHKKKDIKDDDDVYNARARGQYCIGSDIAEGHHGGDFTTAVIFDRDLGKVVGYWHGRIEPYAFASKLALLSKWFNDAYLGVEVNNNGITVIDGLKRTDRFGWLYQRRKFDRFGNPSVREIGWKTTVATKPRLIGITQEFLREDGEGASIPWAILDEIRHIKEIPAKVRGHRPKIQAAPNHFDDLWIGFSVCLVCHLECPYNEPPKQDKRPGRPSLWDRLDGSAPRDTELDRIEDEYMGST